MFSYPWGYARGAPSGEEYRFPLLFFHAAASEMICTQASFSRRTGVAWTRKLENDKRPPDMHKSRPDSISGLIVPSAHLAASNCLLAFPLASLCLGNFSLPCPWMSGRENNTIRKEKLGRFFHTRDIAILICVCVIIRYSGKCFVFEYDFEGELIFDIYIYNIIVL